MSGAKDTNSQENCIYCKRSIPLDSLFEHTTSCEMSSSFKEPPNFREIIGTENGSKETHDLSLILEQTENEDLEITSVKSPSGREVTHLSNDFEFATPPVSLQHEKLETFGISLEEKNTNENQEMAITSVKSPSGREVTHLSNDLEFATPPVSLQPEKFETFGISLEGKNTNENQEMEITGVKSSSGREVTHLSNELELPNVSDPTSIQNEKFPREITVENEDLEITSVKSPSGREVTHLSNEFEFEFVTPPVSIQHEKFETLGVGISLEITRNTNENQDLEKTIFPATLPHTATSVSEYEAMPQTVVLNRDTNFVPRDPCFMNYRTTFQQRMPLKFEPQTIIGHNLQPRMNYQTPIEQTQPLQLSHQSNYHSRATFQNNLPPANQSVPHHYHTSYQQCVPAINYPATTCHLVPLDSEGYSNYSSNRQSLTNAGDTFQMGACYENNPQITHQTAPHNISPRDTFQPPVPPVDPRDTFQANVPPVGYRATFQANMLHVDPSATFQANVPHVDPRATFQTHVPPVDPRATFQTHVPPVDPRATSQTHVPPIDPRTTFQTHVPPLDPRTTFQTHVPPLDPRATFQTHVPPVDPRATFPAGMPQQGRLQTPYSIVSDTRLAHQTTNQYLNRFPHNFSNRPSPPLTHQTTMPILHISQPANQMPHFSQRMPLGQPHPINRTEMVSSGQRLPPSVPNQITPYSEQIGTNFPPISQSPAYRTYNPSYTQPMSHQFNHHVPPRPATLPPLLHSGFGPLQLQIPQSGTFSATSTATFQPTPQPDINRLSPGLGKTVMAAPPTRMTPLDTYATPLNQGFAFPVQSRFQTLHNRASQFISTIPELSTQNEQYPHKPLSAPHSLTGPPDFQSFVPNVPNFTPQERERPPPLPPRKHQSTGPSRWPASSNPNFGFPSEMCRLPPTSLCPPPYNPSFEPNTECSLNPPVTMIESEAKNKCIYCEEEFNSDYIEYHIKEECFSNPDVAERIARISELSSSSSSSSERLDTYHMTPSYSTITSETDLESRDTMTQSGLESLEVEIEDEVCRRCNGKFTMSNLKLHADGCLVRNPDSYPDELTMDTTVATTSLPILHSRHELHDPFSMQLAPSHTFKPSDLFGQTYVPSTTVFEMETEKCDFCGETVTLEEYPTHYEECRDKEEGKCPNCEISFLVTVLPDHTDRCQAGKVADSVAPVLTVPIPKPIPTPRRCTPESNPTSYRRCNLCYQDVPPPGHKCVPLPPGERRDNLCGVCFLELDPLIMETHRIECLKSQQSEYTELHRKNWQRCLSCLIDINPQDFKDHIRTCDDMLLGDISRYKKFAPHLADIDWAIAALTREQRAAMDHVVKNAQIMSNNADKCLSERVAKLSFSPADLEATLEWINFEAPIIIHIFLDKLLPILITDTNYRNQFETGTSHGSRDLGARSRWEDNIFKNIYRDAKGEDRVKYGVLNIVGDINGVKSCKQYGDSYFILKRVRLRTSFASADSSNSTVKIASCEHYKHVLNEYTNSELTAILKVATKKSPYLSSDIIQQYKEVQIHGPIELAEHLECIVVNPRHKSDPKTKELLENFIAKNKCNMIWMS